MIPALDGRRRGSDPKPDGRGWIDSGAGGLYPSELWGRSSYRIYVPGRRAIFTLSFWERDGVRVRGFRNVQSCETALCRGAPAVSIRVPEVIGLNYG